MEFIPSVKDGINNYGMFTGKADRSQFWWFQLFFFLGVIIATIIDYLVFGTPYRFILLLWILFTIIPVLAVGSRRLRDTNRSGWWQLLLIPPIIGWIILIILWSEESFETDPEKRPIGIPQ